MPSSTRERLAPPQQTIYMEDLLIPKHEELLQDVLAHGHTHYTLYGGRGGVKSSAISIIVPLLLSCQPDVHAVVFRKVANTLRDSVFAQLSFGISALGLENYFKSTTSPMEMK